MKIINFFKAHKTLTVILAAILLLTVIWSTVIIMLVENKPNDISTESIDLIVSDVESEAEQSDGNKTDTSAVEKENSTPSSNSMQSATESDESDWNYTSQSNPLKRNEKTDLPELEGGAEVNESPLANTYKLLTLQKKLTIGYFGGSITAGSSAKKIIKKGVVESDEGSMFDSYVNRVSDWFKQKFPEATIETVNVGISDTHSQFGLYRLENTLMNSRGHDMPDLVFIEFTSNDWIYGEHTAEVIKKEVESIVVNIRKINPFADIVIIATNTSPLESSPVKQAHKEIAEHYGLPFIDVGSVLQEKKYSRGASVETSANGTLYYTTDNLHPSAEGFAVYLQTIAPVLSQHLDGLELKSNRLYNYNENIIAPLNTDLITPIIITAEKITGLKETAYMPLPLTASMYGTSVAKASSVAVSDSYVVMEKGGEAVAKFSGNYFGLMISMSSNDIELLYSIDGGEWQAFTVNDSNLSFQRYPHVQAFSLESDLADGEHTVTIKSLGDAEVRIGAILA